MSSGGQTVVYAGIDEVAGFYRGLTEAGMAVAVPVAEKIAVADWGLAFETRFEQVVPGHAVTAQGFAVDDVNAVYRFSIVAAGIASGAILERTPLAIPINLPCVSMTAAPDPPG